ncbi:hypothetical protein FOA52_011275 [Chlamydomonas sp. UWO 241]|nr:hypothetical protein FOA52_011275 [Chlamydomonas sp. UWO 241]
MDSILEKGFADLMRGEGGTNPTDPFPREPCTCSMGSDGEHGTDCSGKWLRTLNGQGNCYVYVHTITHEMRGIRPPNFVTRADLDAERARRDESALGGKWLAFPSCHLAEWREAAVRVFSQEGKTPLLVVDEPHTYTALLASVSSPSGGELVDTRALVLPVARTGIKFEDAFEALSGRMGAALKAGRPIVLDCSDNSPHWLDKLCKAPKYRAKFPEQVFNPRSQAWRGGVSGGPGFAVVLLTTLDPKIH